MQEALIEGIHDPVDLRKLSEAELPLLCDELRAELLEVVSGVGGHLSSSLGVVELTVALHYCLDTPRDLVVWDVGHQAYIHKMLTGRREKMRSIRQHGGLSGFLKRSESPYDCYGAGHASTAISAAWGMAVARELAGDDYRVAAVFGDGALTGGICYEGINNAGDRRIPFLAVLNDNRMSISENVGAIDRYLANFSTTPLYQGFRRRVREGLQRIPRFGQSMTHLAARLEDAAKSVLTRGALFEALGFDYYGPVDGHDVVGLVNILKGLRDADRPILLHVITTKGKGYAPAEVEPESYHGVKPFVKENGIESSGSPDPPFQTVFGETMIRLAREDPRLVGVTAAMPSGTGLGPYAKAFPDRFFDVGIAEEHAVIFACGLAAKGYRPVCAVYSTFLQRAYDPIIHDAALQQLPVIFCLDRSGLVGEDGPTHHGSFDLSYLRHIPGMVVASPRDGNELRNLLAAALAYEGGPFAIRYPKGSASPWDARGEILQRPIGTWEVLEEGAKVALLATGSMVEPARRARALLVKEGLSPEVVDCAYVKPLDESYLARNAGRCEAVITVEDNATPGGFGSAVLEWLTEEGFQVPLTRLALPDAFTGHGSRGRLLRELGLTAEGIRASVHERLKTQGMSRPSLAP